MKNFSNTLVYAALIVCGLVMVYPFVWMMSTSLKSEMQATRGGVELVPRDQWQEYTLDGVAYQAKPLKMKGDSLYVHLFTTDGTLARPFYKINPADLHEVNRIHLRWSNFKTAWNKVPFNLYFRNTIITTFFTLLGVLITSALAAYAFARMQFRGRDTIFFILLTMMMVPQPVYLVPSYIILHKLGWLDTFAALIVPWTVNIFTVFLFRQHFKTLPQDLFDAASIDGCSRLGILWHVVLPLSKPVIVTASVFSVIGSWNSFMWPLIVTNSEKLRVLQVGLSYFSQESASQTTLLMAASAFSVLPLILLFFIAQKQIIGSVATSGMKE